MESRFTGVHDYTLDVPTMKTEVHLTPETEDEVQLLEMLAEAREFALEEAEMDPASAAGIFAQMAAGLAGEGEVEEGDYECPNCGRAATGVTGSELGGQPEVKPCGCELEWEEVPPELYMD